MRRICIAMIGLLAACGDDLDPNSCQPDGWSDGLATVQGEALGPWVRAAQFPVGTMHALVFDEVAGACGEVAPTGKHLVLLMCEPPEEKNYRIVAERAFQCPGNEVHAVIERDGGTDIAGSLDGTLRIDSAIGCVRGSYTITLDTIDDIEGSFDAVVCN
jgi:hypothetical protein